MLGMSPKHRSTVAEGALWCCRESVAINSSLMTLGRCLEALRWNQQHKGSTNLRVVPYRESKVTHLFRRGAATDLGPRHCALAGLAVHACSSRACNQQGACVAGGRSCRDALHGWGQVILSVNVSPVSKDYDETAHVLKARAASAVMQFCQIEVRVPRAWLICRLCLLN